jgi:hypothetical protein
VPRPTPKLEDHPLPAVRDLFNLFAVTLHSGGRSATRNLRTRHAVVTGAHTHGMFCLLKANTITLPQQGHEDIIPYPFKIIIHRSSHYRLYD